MNKLLHIIRNNVLFFTLIIAIVAFRSSIADWNTIPSESMLPNLQVGDRVYVNKLAYDLRLPLTGISLVHFDTPKMGDVVVFDSEKAGKKLIKRVIGLPGDKIALRQNQLWVNGESAHYESLALKQSSEHPALTDSLFHESLREHQSLIRIEARGVATPYASFGPIQVPPGHIFVMGDNRQNSADSRVYGFVPQQEIRGRATHVILSLDSDNYYLPRSNRFIARIN